MNRKRYDGESNLITGSKNKKCQQLLRGVGMSGGGDCGACRWDATARVAHRRHDFRLTGENGRMSTQCRFTLLPEQRMRRKRSDRAVSSKCVVWGLFAIGRIGRQPGWRDHHARNMNGGSEHLNGCSQWARVESQIIITNITWGRRALSSPQRSHGE